MTKHPAQDTHTPPGCDGRPETGDESHARNSGPKQTLSSATGKWLIVKGLAFWHVFPPDADRVVFGTWEAAMAYVNQQIRAEQQRYLNGTPYDFMMLPNGTVLRNQRIQARINEALERLDNAKTLGVLGPVEAGQ